MTPRKCTKGCPKCCEAQLSNTGKILVENQENLAASLTAWSKAITRVFVGLTVCLAFLGILGFSCYAQYAKFPFQIDFTLMGFFFVCLGTMIGVSVKEIAQLIPKMGGK